MGAIVAFMLVAGLALAAFCRRFVERPPPPSARVDPTRCRSACRIGRLALPPAVRRTLSRRLARSDQR